uniref:Uncharacterized protein n=1 Tax=Anguilla anguilla TaxID=7936 RepID=A0A0E9XKE8_ANGAN
MRLKRLRRALKLARARPDARKQATRKQASQARGFSSLTPGRIPHVSVTRKYTPTFSAHEAEEVSSNPKCDKNSETVFCIFVCGVFIAGVLHRPVVNVFSREPCQKPSIRRARREGAPAQRERAKLDARAPTRAVAGTRV